MPESVKSVEWIIRHRGSQSNAAVVEANNNMGRWMGMRVRRRIIIWGRWMVRRIIIIIIWEKKVDDDECRCRCGG